MVSGPVTALPKHNVERRGDIRTIVNDKSNYSNRPMSSGAIGESKRELIAVLVPALLPEVAIATRILVSRTTAEQVE